MHRLCREHRIWSRITRKGRKAKCPGPPVHDDLVRRGFAVAQIDSVWFTGITEHPTDEGKLSLRDQGRVLLPHRRLRDGRAHDRTSGRGGLGVGDRAPQTV